MMDSSMSLADRVQSAFSRHATLFKNSGALMLGTGFTSVLGFVYWWYAARSFSPEVIGIASAFISVMWFIGIIGEAGIGTLLVGEIGQWQRRKDGLITAALITCITICLIVSLLSLPLTRFVADSNIIDDILLIIGCGLTGFSFIIDQAFLGMLQSTFRMVRQFFYSVVRLVALLVVSIWFSNELVILISWVGSLGLSMIFGVLLMRRYGQSFVHRPDFDLLLKLKGRVIGHYMLDLGMMTPAVIMPYLTTVLISPTSNAAFTMIWMVLATVSNVPGALAQVLFPVVRASPDQYQEKMRLSFSISLLFAVAFAVGMFCSSKTILWIFNPRYVEIGGDYLGLLGVGLIGSVVKYHWAAAARLENRMRRASVWACLAGLFELAGASIGALHSGLAGLSIGWGIATMIEGVVMWVFANPCHAPNQGVGLSKPVEHSQPNTQNQRHMTEYATAAVVIGGNLNALSVCRNLGQCGVPTYALDTQRWCPALLTRYAKPLLARGMHDQKLIDTLLTLPKEVGDRPVLIITNEMSLLTISQRRAEILDRFRLHLPSHQTLLTLQDKARFHEFAIDHDLPVPNGIVLRQTSDSTSLGGLRFPVVIKPADKCDVHLNRTPRLVTAHDYKQARNLCRKILERTSGEVIVQERISGPDTNIYFCLFYRGDHQIVMFSGQKLASSPPGTGSTAICIYAGDARESLEDATHRFLETVPDYRGFGSVEFKWDDDAQRWVIIEPTVGRTDWQEEIATLLGVNLPLAGYFCECNLPVPPMIPRNENLVWQASWVERWKVGSSGIPANAMVVDGFCRRDDPLPAIVHYPVEFAYAFPALMIALTKRMRGPHAG
jgi:D-aspartate ligase